MTKKTLNNEEEKILLGTTKAQRKKMWKEICADVDHNERKYDFDKKFSQGESILLANPNYINLINIQNKF